MKWTQAISRELTDVFFPLGAQCLLCNDPRNASSVDCLCDACRIKVQEQRLHGTLCPRCMAPMDAHGICSLCGGKGIAGCDYAYAAFIYEDIPRYLILTLKFNWRNEPAAALGREMALSIPDAFMYDALVPVPLYYRRQRYRGKNQAEVLAREVSRHTGLPVWEALRRVQDTTAQTALDKEQRRKNVAGAFAPSMVVNDMRLLLVDDVRTTGATLISCAHVLREAGAAGVDAITAAITLPGRARKL